jgi:hypothetical protein
MLAGVPFGFGMVLVFLSIMNYLIDSYTIYAASVLAASAVLRSLFGAVFPLFTTQMFQKLGDHWASSIPALLSLACVPFPFVLYKYGESIRRRCKYAAEADAYLQKLVERSKEQSVEKIATEARSEENGPSQGGDTAGQFSRLSLTQIPTRRLQISRNSIHRIPTIEYDGNPFDIDRINTY